MTTPSPYHNPPRLAEWLMARIFPDEGGYSTLGDLSEVYNYLVEAEGSRRANVWYWMQLFRSISPVIVNIMYWGGIMFRNYMVVALRNLRSQKVYTVINVFGLALAIACAVLIYHYVRSETTYDTFHADHENIYRVTSLVHFRGMEQWDSTPYPLAEVIEEQVPGLEAVAQLNNFLWPPDIERKIIAVGELLGRLR